MRLTAMHPILGDVPFLSLKSEVSLVVHATLENSAFNLFAVGCHCWSLSLHAFWNGSFIHLLALGSLAPEPCSHHPSDPAEHATSGDSRALPEHPRFARLCPFIRYSHTKTPVCHGMLLPIHNVHTCSLLVGATPGYEPASSSRNVLDIDNRLQCWPSRTWDRTSVFPDIRFWTLSTRYEFDGACHAVVVYVEWLDDYHLQ